MKDFFISYTGADKEWAEWIAWQLEEAGYSVIIQAWDFRPGDDFVKEMDRAFLKAERMLAVLTPGYFESRFTQAEWSVAFAKENLLPVRVDDFDVEGLLSGRLYIDLAGKNESQAKDALMTGVKSGRVKPSSPPAFPRQAAPARPAAEAPVFPGALPPVWNVPHQRNRNFVGRDALLKEMEEALASNTAAALTAIHGMGELERRSLPSSMRTAMRRTTGLCGGSGRKGWKRWRPTMRRWRRGLTFGRRMNPSKR